MYLVEKESRPLQISVGITLGMALGLFPITTLQWWFALGLLLVIRANLFAALISGIFFFITYPLFYSLFDGIGERLLLYTPSLWGTYTRLYHAPIVPYTGFNHTVILGQLVLMVPVVLIACPLIAFLINHQKDRIRQIGGTKLWINWSCSWLHRRYIEYRSQFKS